MKRFGYSTKKSPKKAIWATVLSVLVVALVVVGVCFIKPDSSNKITLNVLSNGETNSETIKFKGDTLTEEVLSEVLENDKVFSGWYYDDNYTQKAKVGDIVDGDLRLYSRQMSLIEGAYWERVENQLDLPEIGTTGGSSTFESPFSTAEGTGTSSDPYIITTSEDMGVFSRLINDTETDTHYLSASYKLAGDIRLDTVDVTWPSVGSSTNPFTGTFDGDNHMIYYIFGTKGVFNYIQNATIKNLVIKGIKINATTDNVGGLVSNALDNVLISNCHLWGNITSSNDNVGGLVGKVFGESIEQNIIETSTTTVRVKGLGSVGGILGYATNATIQGCLNSGIVESTYVGDSSVGGIVGYIENGKLDHVVNNGKISGYYAVGGIVGHAENGTNSVCLTAYNVINTGSVSGNDTVGGIGGYVLASLTNAVNIGIVEATDDYVAGLIGNISANATISNSYSLGNIICDNASATHVDPIGLGDFTAGTKCGFNNIIRIGGKIVDSQNSDKTTTKGVNLYDGNAETEYSYMINSLKSKSGFSNYLDSSSGISWNISYPWKTNIFNFTDKFPTIPEKTNLNEITYKANFYINGTLKYIIIYKSTEAVVAPTITEKIDWFADADFTTAYTFGSTLSSDVSIYGKQEKPKEKFTVSLVSDKSGVTLSPNNYLVEEGSSYTGTFTNKSGYKITGVSVTMAGNDSPEFTYNTSTKTVKIENVTGNTQITPIFGSAIQFYTITFTTDVAGVSITSNNASVEEETKFSDTITNTSNKTILGLKILVNQTKYLTYGVDYEFNKTTNTFEIYKVTGNILITPFYDSGNGVPSEIVPLCCLAPAQISAIANVGVSDVDSNGNKVWKVNNNVWFNIGDKTSIKLTDGQIFKVAIGDFNHDITSNGDMVIPFTFVGMSLLKDNYYMNEERVNTGGWATSDMRTYLNETVLGLFSSEWQEVFTATSKISTIGKKSSSVSTSENKLFLLSYTEVNGDSVSPYTKEGTLYPIFTDDSSRIRSYIDSDGVSGSADWWWLRSPYVKYAVGFRSVGEAGNVDDIGDYYCGVCPAFCIGNGQPKVSIKSEKTEVSLTPNDDLVKINGQYTGTFTNGTDYLITDVAITMEGTESATYTFNPETLVVTISNVSGNTIVTPIFSCVVTLETSTTGITLNSTSEAVVENGQYVGTITNTSTKTIIGFKAISDGTTYLTYGVDYTYNSQTKTITIFHVLGNIKLIPFFDSGNGIPSEVVPLVCLTPSQIRIIASLGTSSTNTDGAKVWKVEDVEWFNIGDSTAIKLTDGQIFKIAIADFNHDVTADGTTALPITFVGKSLLTQKHNINTEKVTTGGWNDSEMRTYLNSTILDLIPSDWKTIINQTKKTATIGDKSTDVVDSIDRLFLLSFSEVGLTNDTYDATYYSKEGTVYEIFKSSDDKIRYYLDDLGANSKKGWWYLRSPNPTSDTSFKCISLTGRESYYAVTTVGGICPAFCVGLEPSAPVITQKSLSEYSTEELTEIVKNGELGTDSDGNKVWKYNDMELLHIGDSTSITLTDGQVLNIAIADFNHDVASDGTTTIPFTFVATNLLDLTHEMNPSTSSNKYGTNVGGWNESSMRTYLNSDIWYLFPQDWQALIKTAHKTSTIGNKLTDVSSSDDNLWLLSYTEVGLTSSAYSTKYYSKEGTVYPIFSDSTSRIRSNSTEAIRWWLRSPNPQYNNRFMVISADGSESHIVAYNSMSFCIAFCVGV